MNELVLEIAGAYRIQPMGHTARYEVYDVLLLPGILERNPRTVYRNTLTELIEAAQSRQRQLWWAVDIGNLTPSQLGVLFYQIVLPFIRARIISRTYRNPTDADLAAAGSDDNITLINRIMRSAFQHVPVMSRLEAFPPDLVLPPNPPEPPTS